MSLDLQAPSNSAPPNPGRTIDVLGTPLLLTDYAQLAAFCHERARWPGSVALEFTNTHIVTSRRHEPTYRAVTAAYDWFVPDATPLIWCLNAAGAGLRDRVYGPTFMRECFQRTTAPYRHYLLGGSSEVGTQLQRRLRELNPAIQLVGSFHGRCSLEGALEGAADRAVPDEINRLEADFIWVGLGTPKQDAWVQRNKARFPRGVILSVGFAFDVNAGAKADAPPAFQRLGLTWLFRLASEPRRLLGRYVKYNSLFLAYLVWDGLRGRAFRVPSPS